MVIWLVGLSGAGKSTIAKALYTELKQLRQHTVLIDGDEIRELFKHDQTAKAYSLEGRRLNAERIQALCRWLDRQKIDVVCSMLCVFPHLSEQNRKDFSKYKEIFVDVPIQKLIERDNKGLYKACLSGETKNVVGIDIPYTAPENPDLVIRNRYDEEDMPMFLNEIMQLISEDADEV